MTDDLIPETARVFILENIESIAEMECILMFFYKPDVELDAVKVSSSLYITEYDAGRLLERLLQAGFLVKNSVTPSVYKYAPRSSKLENGLKEVADLYKRYLLPVTHIIHSKSKTRVQEFANAFRIRKDKSDG